MKSLDEALDALGTPRDPPRTTTAAERIARDQLDGGDLFVVLEDPELQSLHAKRVNSPEELARIAHRTKEVILAQDASLDPLPVRPVGGRR